MCDANEFTLMTLLIVNLNLVRNFINFFDNDQVESWNKEMN